MAESEIHDNAPEMGQDREETMHHTSEFSSENTEKDKKFDIKEENLKTNDTPSSFWNNNHFDFGKLNLWIQRFVSPGFWDWPPAKKWGKGGNDDLVKKGKSPMEIWEVHSNNILKQHEESKEYHENILKDYEQSKKDGPEQTMMFWKKYWNKEFETEFPNPKEMEERWKVWRQNEYSKETFWEEERKKFKKDSGWNFWKKRKAECQELRKEMGHSRRCLKIFHVERNSDNTSISEMPIFQMFDF